MASTTSARPNHYEMLGLSPTATDDEIQQAFVREISPFRPRAFGGLAEVGIAYETLRDPARRRAYDESIGLGVPPEPKAEPEWTPFLIRASAHPAKRPGVDPLHRPARRPEPPAPPEPLVDPRLAAIAATMRELAKSGAYDGSPARKPIPEPPRPAVAETKPTPEPKTVISREPDPIADEPVDEVEQGPIEWRRPALIAGALIMGVGMIGAWAGVVAGNEVEPKEAEAAVTLAIPPAKRAPAATAASLSAPAPGFAETRQKRRVHAAPGVRRAHRQPPPQRALSAKELDELPFVEVGGKASVQADAATSPTVAEAPAVTTATARMSLPDKVIARTIHRIGYACGDVASTTAVEGQAGVFNVTCTSGHSYRAAPVHGRYHFRRVGSR